MGVWEYTGLAVILFLIYSNENSRETVKSFGKKVLDIIENGFDL